MAYHNVLREKTVLSRQLARAKEYNRAATLTFEQWIDTLDHFDWKCAYCGFRDHEIMEHFIPISRGGGTTQRNCVPACQSCNMRKSNHHPLIDPPEKMKAAFEIVHHYLRSKNVEWMQTLEAYAHIVDLR